MKKIRARAKFLTALLALCGIGILSWGCESGTSEPATRTYSVQYLVAGESLLGGSASLNSVFYDDESGTQTVQFDPAEEGWSQTVTLSPGDTIFLRAEGAVIQGRLRIQIGVLADDGSLFARTNDSMPFGDDPDAVVEIGREVLP